jgi:hypothetical protein
VIRLRERDQSERRNIGKGSEAMRSLQVGYRGKECVGSGVREEIPFQGLLEGVVLLFRTYFCSLRLRMRGFHDLLRAKPSSLFTLGWSSVSSNPVSSTFQPCHLSPED